MLISAASPIMAFVPSPIVAAPGVHGVSHGALLRPHGASASAASGALKVAVPSAALAALAAARGTRLTRRAERAKAVATEDADVGYRSVAWKRSGG